MLMRDRVSGLLGTLFPAFSDDNPSPDLRITHFTVDTTRSVFYMYYYQPHESNHWFFERFPIFGLEGKGWTPCEVPIVIAPKAKEEKAFDEYLASWGSVHAYPFLLLSLSNETPDPIAIQAISMTVYDTVTVMTLGLTYQPELGEDVTIKITPEKGQYSQRLLPVLTIAAQGTAELGIRVLPCSPDDRSGEALIADLRLHWNSKYVATSRFLLDVDVFYKE